MAGINRKYWTFISQPMGQKSVKELAGIDEALGDRLIEAGFEKAQYLLGQYLILRKDEKSFIDWLMEICNASSKQAKDCYHCLNDWAEEFI